MCYTYRERNPNETRRQEQENPVRKAPLQRVQYNYNSAQTAPHNYNVHALVKWP